MRTHIHTTKRSHHSFSSPGRKETTFEETHFSPFSSCQTCYINSHLVSHQSISRSVLSRVFSPKNMCGPVSLSLSLFCSYLQAVHQAHLTLHGPARIVLPRRTKHKVEATLLKSQSHSSVSWSSTSTLSPTYLLFHSHKLVLAGKGGPGHSEIGFTPPRPRYIGRFGDNQ